MKNRFYRLLISACIFAIAPAKAQFTVPGYGMQKVIGGYAKDSIGEVLPYFSSYQQFAKEALLTRCTDGNKIISWQSAPVPADFKSDFCYFYFLAGHSTGTSKADRKFDLFINGEKYLTFTTPQKRKPPFHWSFTGKDSVQLIFEATFEDIYNDAHGNLFLKVPKSLLVPGKPLQFSITGQPENSNDWFMIFRYVYAEKVQVLPTPLLIKSGNKIRQIIRIKADHTYHSNDTLKLKILSKNYSYVLKPGYNYFELAIDTVNRVVNESILASIGTKYKTKINVRFQPVHRREVSVIHHSHNDIGYSNLQDDVAAIQNENIRNAMKLVEQTKNYPEGCRFKWNIESVWAIDNFLNEATTEEKDRFFNAVRQKQIGLSGHYANILTGLCKPEELSWITERAVALREKFNLPINSVMFTDIPGVSWTQVQALADDGFRYFSSGPNYQPHMPDKGERIGGTIRELGDKPFYWKSENGKSQILFWVAGCGYSMFHQIPPADLNEKRKDKLVEYMNALDSSNYPYEMVQLRYNIKSDNGPVDSTLCDFVKAWNETYVSPKLVITTVSDMMEKFEQRYGKELPVRSGDFTPYWEDGAYSTANEEGRTRIVSERIIQLQKLYALMPSKDVDTNWFHLARRSVIMFHEHTWGSWNSISEPDIPFTTKQWDYKKRFLDSAEYYVSQIENILMPAKTDFRFVEVWNTFNWIRSGNVEVACPPGIDTLVLADERGLAVHYDLSVRKDKISFNAMYVPANGARTYRFLPRHETTANKDSRFLTLFFEIDSLQGALKRLRRNSIDLVDSTIYAGLNSAWVVQGLDPKAFRGATVRKIEQLHPGSMVKREYEITCSLEGCNEIKYRLSMLKDLSNVIHCSVTIDKKSIREKESIHIAFPFNLPGVTTRIGIGDTCITPEQGQLVAANRDFYSVQRWIDVSDSSQGVTLSSPQCALWEVGSMIDERRLDRGEKVWKKENTSSATLFAYVMNNYWNTNYKADQPGVATFDFYIRLHDKFSLKEAQQFGYEASQPLIVVVK